MENTKVYPNRESTRKKVSKKPIPEKPLRIYTFEEAKDLHLGKTGTPERDKFERDMEGFHKSFSVGQAIKQARISKNLTQKQMGALIGVKGPQISRIENGENMTVSTIYKIFSALEIPVTINVEGICSIHLTGCQETE